MMLYLLIFTNLLNCHYSFTPPSKKFFSALLLAGLLSLPQLSLILKTSHTGFITWHFGWMAESENIIIFWLRNLGVPIILTGTSWFLVSKEIKKYLLPLLLLFVIANLLQFQPHIYDNMKIMLWGFVTVCLMSAYAIARLPKIFLPVILFLWMATGILSVYRETTLSWLMFSKEDLALSEFIRRNTPEEALFLTSDKHNNPVNCLAGRKVFLGFRGWLWTHGIDYRSREADWLGIYHGDWDLIRKNKIDYVLLERDKFNDLRYNEAFFRENFPLVYESQNYLLFKT